MFSSRRVSTPSSRDYAGRSTLRGWAARVYGRGRYFRLLFIGYFEGLSSERGIAWRVADSLSLRSFLDLDVTEAAPDHSTMSRTRRLIDVETHVAVFTWVLERLAAAGLLRGKTVGIDATTLEANAAMRSIERRDTGESYEAFIRRLAEASGVETPTQADLARFDRSRKNKKTSNKEWKSPQDPDAKIASSTPLLVLLRPAADCWSMPRGSEPVRVGRAYTKEGDGVPPGVNAVAADAGPPPRTSAV